MRSELMKAWDRYEQFVYWYAANQFDKIIRPWLIENGLEFVAGMGVWSVVDKHGRYGHTLYGGTGIIDKDYLPDNILAVLKEEIPGMNANDVGSLMPDYVKEIE